MNENARNAILEAENLIIIVIILSVFVVINCNVFNYDNNNTVRVSICVLCWFLYSDFQNFRLYNLMLVVFVFFFLIQIFDGNVDGTNGKRNMFGQKLFTRCLRFHPKSWTGGCSMKVDVTASNEGKVASSYQVD